ncbi:MAG: hypothetical protein Q8K30_06125 [Candidatus Gracilibacteria bacterium]|nr:hypothetical protein [Candidatus Gracilibacteria bacterium]
MYIKQKYKYDCGVAGVYNLLKSVNIDFDYLDLKKELNTTTLWGTIPKNIDNFLINNGYYNLDFKISLVLVSSDKFYSSNEEDYGHYINIINICNNIYKVFDPWDGRYYYIEKSKLINMTLNVLVGPKFRYNKVKYLNIEF